MPFRLLAFALTFVSFSVLANGRAPAVEDFVGIEVDHVESTPQGTESLYNLETDLEALKRREAEALNVKPMPEAPEFKWTPLTVTAGGLLALIPMFACLVMMRRLRRTATIESASNIEVLEKYRLERQARKKTDSKKVA